MTNLEQQINECFDHSVNLWNSIMAIENELKHKMDDQETCTDIHNIQNRLFSIANSNGIIIKS